MKRAVFVLTVSLLFTTACTHSQSATETLIAQAMQNVDAMLNKDYEVVVHLTYPPIVEELGGFQKALALVKSTMSAMESRDVTVEKITVGQPSAIVEEGKEQVAIVPIELMMSIEGDKIRADSYLVAITQNNGKNWFFIDGSSISKEKLSLIFPNLVASVEIPEFEMTFLSDK